MTDYAFENAMYELGSEVLELVGQRSASRFLQGSGQPVEGQVTSRTGKLMKSILGETTFSHRKTEVGESSASFEIGSKVRYASLMELGGVRTVTDKMRKFFWHKYFTDTGDLKDMWARLRFKNVIHYKPRPYLEPAMMDVVEKDLPKLLSKYVYKYFKSSIQQLIVGEAKAAGAVFYGFK